MRARLPGQGHPHRGRPGLGGGRPLHKLWQLHHGVLAGAKAYKSSIEGALALLDRGVAAALLAPSFPAGSTAPPEQVVGALRKAGFTYVVEVAFGADQVNQACHDYLAAHPTGLHIASACPAVVEYVRKYHPELTGSIMPIVSPMVATALEVKQRYGQHVRCVFIGPCVAKKAEILDSEVVGVVDEVLTLVELQRVLAARERTPRWRRPVTSTRRTPARRASTPYRVACSRARA